MKKVIIDGKEITTNLGESGAYAIVAGNDLPNYTMMLPKFAESDTDFVSRLVEMGYTRIRLARTTTCVRGLYKMIAYCRRAETKLWATESRQYFSTLKEAKMNAEYCDTPWTRFNGIHYDSEKKMYCVSYMNKY